MSFDLPGSASVLDQAIGPYGSALAHLLGASDDTIELWRCDPPSFTSPQGAKQRGRRNPLSEIYAIATRCPGGLSAVQWLCERLDGHFECNTPPPERGELPILDGALILAAAEKLCRKLRRLPRADMEDLRDSLCDSLAALVELELKRRASK